MYLEFGICYGPKTLKFILMHFLLEDETNSCRNEHDGWNKKVNDVG